MFGNKILRVFLISCLLAYLFCVEDVSAAPITNSIESTTQIKKSSRIVKKVAVTSLILQPIRMTVDPGPQSTKINRWFQGWIEI